MNDLMFVTLKLYINLAILRRKWFNNVNNFEIEKQKSVLRFNLKEANSEVFF
jgi:hypothetical protein